MRQLPAGGWAYRILRALKQWPMSPAVGSATAPAAATAAPTTTESATVRADRAIAAAISAQTTATTTIACSSKKTSRTRKSGLHRTGSAMRACVTALTASISATAARHPAGTAMQWPPGAGAVAAASRAIT